MKPNLEAFAIREERRKSYWTRIGVAFPNKDGGSSILLDAMPASRDGRYTIVLRPIKERDEAAKDEG